RLPPAWGWGWGGRGCCGKFSLLMFLTVTDTTMGVFHWQSPRGKYSFTYTEAMDACVAEGATLATFSQLAAAQQVNATERRAIAKYSNSAHVL
uniref:Link domain-containing protein n=1 Tax=Callorhinchus milii TaxID=7868 RepID=A0A4W3HV32_CALMI